MKEVEYFTWFNWNDFIEPKKRKLVMVGVCSRTGRIAKLGGMLEALVIGSTRITDGHCEEAEHCLDLRCDLNKTTWESLWRGTNLRRIPRKPEDFEPGKGLNALDFSELVESARVRRQSQFVCRKRNNR